MAGKSLKHRASGLSSPKSVTQIGYAQRRPSFRSGEIRVLDSTGNIERVISFSETDPKL
jgi:hypothetical protein